MFVYIPLGWWYMQSVKIDEQIGNDFLTMCLAQQTHAKYKNNNKKCACKNSKVMIAI